MSAALINKRVPAVILAGGRSSRMGGGDKCLLTLGTGTLLAHVIAALAAQAGDILINSNSDPGLFRETGLPVCADTMPGRHGPLAGILTAMVWARERSASRVLTVPADTPFLPRDLVARLADRPGDGPVIASHLGERHPVIGLWPVALAGCLERTIERGVRSVRAWLDTVPHDIAEFPSPRFDPFWNVNTPEDWRRACDLNRHVMEPCG